MGSIGSVHGPMGRTTAIDFDEIERLDLPPETRLMDSSSLRTRVGLYCKVKSRIRTDSDVAVRMSANESPHSSPHHTDASIVQAYYQELSS